MEFKNPATSLELHAGSKDVAQAIMAILGDLKGAESAHGLKEVARASQASTNSKNRKIGRLLYDFEAQGSDELNCREGDEVYIVDEKKSKDWWMVENVDTGKQGVVPSTYIEIVGTSNLDKLTDGPLRRKSGRSKGRVVDGKEKRYHSRNREERDRIREKIELKEINRLPQIVTMINTIRTNQCQIIIELEHGSIVLVPSRSKLNFWVVLKVKYTCTKLMGSRLPLQLKNYLLKILNMLKESLVLH